MINVLYFVLMAISLGTLLSSGFTSFELGNIHFYILLAILIIDFINNRRFSLLTFWIISFIYIILSDILLVNYSNIYDSSVKYLLCANDLYIGGYLINRQKVKITDLPVYIFKDVITFRYIICFLYIFVLLFLFGRFYVPTLKYLFRSNIFLEGFLSSAALIISLLLGYYIVKIKNKSPITAVAIVSPVIYFLFLDGTRYRLLYAIVPFLIIIGYIPLAKMRLRSFLMICVIGVVAIYSSAYVKHNRRGRGGNDIENVEFFDINNHPYKTYLSVKVAQYGSPETIVEMTYLANRHFSTNPLKYGAQTAMILYFWVPRNIWPNKPTMIDSWLPKLYMRGVSDNFSSASGFTGELRADFGSFSLFILFYLGLLMKKADNYLQNIYSTIRENYFILYLLLL